MSKMFPLLDVDIRPVTVSRKHIGSSALDHKVDLAYLLTVLQYILLLLHVNGPDDRAYPGNETFVFLVEERDIGIHLLVDDHCYLQFKFVGQFVHEVADVLLLLAVVVLYGFHHFVEELLVQLVVVLNLIKSAHFLF